MFALGIDYITGYAAATDPWNRSRAEWPPHPARVFMALAAAYFETRPNIGDPDAQKDWEEEAEALRWLERLPPPGITSSAEDRRRMVDVYVPPNDMSGNKITVIPAFRTNKQPRTFPRVRPHQSEVYLTWPEGNPSKSQRAALERLCQKVIRIGHSSSFVRMWVTAEGACPALNLVPAEENDRRTVEHRLRVVSAGCLQYLKDQFNGERIERFYELAEEIRAARGKAKNELQSTFEKEFGTQWKRSLDAPPSLRPALNLTREYVKNVTARDAAPRTTWFDNNLLVLAKLEGSSLGLESTWQIITALRGAIEKYCEPTPEWVSGHQPDGKPSENPHLALLPLGFAGSEYADGHLLGLALAFPRNIPTKERGRTLRNLLYNATGTSADIRLTLGKAGVWTLRLEERPSPPLALQAETWTAAPAGATTWASVSPVVLDRHPNADPSKDRVAWIAEVSGIVASACERIGLPQPAEIDIDKTSWHKGAPRAKPGPDGYPLMPQRPGGPNRRQVHVWLKFDQPVLGPVLLGAGRYRGYGLCKPWRGGGQQ